MEQDNTKEPAQPSEKVSVGVKDKAEKKDVVEVDRAMLESILADVQSIKDQNAKLTKDNEMLKDVADKGRVQRYQQTHYPNTLVRTARAWIWNDQIVKASLTIRNEAYYDSFNRAYTDQVLMIVLADGSEVQATYEDFHKRKQFKKGEVIGRNQTDKGDFWKLKFEDGEEKEINCLFLN